VPDAPAWLRESFKNGVDWQARQRLGLVPERAEPVYRGANPLCFLAQFDEAQVPCGGQVGKVLERFHFIGRQRVRNALSGMLRWAIVEEPVSAEMGGGWFRAPFLQAEVEALVMLAEWDARNGEVGCELHHRRYDSHAVSTDAPRIVIPCSKVPRHVDDFALDWGLGVEHEQRFPLERCDLPQL
jgi:hypothetical protein